LYRSRARGRVVDRYDRQTALPEVGEDGQARLAASTVVIVGVGALGSIEAELLARAGVGHLVFIDPDVVEESNLQRQALYTEQDLGKHKAEAAKRHVLAINSTITVTAIVDRLDAVTLSLLEKADVVLDGTDNFATRYLMNERCRNASIPCVFVMVAADRGSLFVSRPGGPCLVCALGERSIKEDAGTAGILNMTTHLAGTLAAFEAMKLLLGETRSVSSTGAATATSASDGVYQEVRAGGVAPSGGDPHFSSPHHKSERRVAVTAGMLFSFGLFDGRFDRLIVPARQDCPVCKK